MCIAKHIVVKTGFFFLNAFKKGGKSDQKKVRLFNEILPEEEKIGSELVSRILSSTAFLGLFYKVMTHKKDTIATVSF